MGRIRSLVHGPSFAHDPPSTPTHSGAAYARAVARIVYFLAWPMVNIYNRRLGFEGLPGPRLGSVLPAATPNRQRMLNDYVEPSGREVACPNQDVVYGGGPVAFDIEPVVIQAPDFEDRFWVYQFVDLRTDSCQAAITRRKLAHCPSFALHFAEQRSDA